MAALARKVTMHTPPPTPDTTAPKPAPKPSQMPKAKPKARHLKLIPLGKITG